MSVYTLYTGCTPRIAEPELLKATLSVAEHLGIDLIRKREYSCCGGSHTPDVDDFETLLLNARNLAYADLEGVDMVTICNTCQLVLSDARKRLLDDENVKNRVNERLSKFNLEFRGTSRVRHFLYILLEDVGLGVLKEKIVKPLTGLRVASFYGCHNIRPASLAKSLNSGESPWQPRSMDRLVEALGGEPVYYETANSCCGFHLALHSRKTAEKMTGKVLRQAYEAGADLIITPCPLCHTNLDSMQPESFFRVGKGPRLPFGSTWLNSFKVALPAIEKPVSIPVLHVEQLVGIALGLHPKRLGFRHHVIPLKHNEKLKNLAFGK